MTIERIRACPSQEQQLRGDEMLEPDEVQAMRGLHEKGWGARRIAAEFGVSRNTVRKYIRAGGWMAYKQPKRAKKLDGLEDWLKARFLRHRGNADVVRQELLAEKDITVSLRTVERAVQPYRQELRAEARATVRFETKPGQQLQIDFGERLIEIGGEKRRVHLFVATLGFSRRIHVRAFLSERQASWFDGLESAFAAFGGVTQDMLVDNARALVDRHEAKTRKVTFNAKFSAFAKHWGFTPRACAPYRARTKGKTESGVGYVKHNAIAGRTFDSFEALEAHLAAWTRDVADTRVHGTTGEAPMLRFERDEASELTPVKGIPPWQTMRELNRKVHSDCMVDVDANSYSVPWRLIGESVSVTVTEKAVCVRHAGKEVAKHDRLEGSGQRSIDPAHFEGVAGFKGRPVCVLDADDQTSSLAEGEVAASPALLRPLAEYEAHIGGGF